MASALRLITVVTLLLAALGSSHAASLYRWTDETGTTHYAAEVPKRYQASATKVDAAPPPVSSTDRARALSRAARDKAQAALLSASAASASVRAPVATAAASRPTGPEPLPDNPSAAQCDQLWRDYSDSQACFAPYQRREGGTRVEAYQVCRDVLNPSSKCGPPRE